MSAEQDVKDVLDRFARAIHDKDAQAALACYGDGVVAFDLSPPLAQAGAELRSAPALDAWFATWDGPIDFEERDVAIDVEGALACARALRRMHGRKQDGTEVAFWYRSTAVLRHRNGQWSITHTHNSVPMAMDGSGKALLDLVPDSY